MVRAMRQNRRHMATVAGQARRTFLVKAVNQYSGHNADPDVGKSANTERRTCRKSKEDIAGPSDWLRRALAIRPMHWMKRSAWMKPAVRLHITTKVFALLNLQRFVATTRRSLSHIEMVWWETCVATLHGVIMSNERFADAASCGGETEQ